METWEDLDTNNEEQWPTFAEAERKLKQQNSEKKANSVFTENGLRTAHPYFESQPKLKILSRKAGDDQQKGPSNLVPVSTEPQAVKSLEDRERDYAEARRRILGDPNAQQKPIQKDADIAKKTAYTNGSPNKARNSS